MAIRKDLDLPFALDIAVALERFYRRFHETLGSPLEFYVLDESPEFYIYGSAKAFAIGPVKGEAAMRPRATR